MPTLPTSALRRNPGLDVVEASFAPARRCLIPGCSELVPQEHHRLCVRHKARLRVLAPQIASLLAHDPAERAPDDDTPRPVVPLNAKLIACAPCSGMRVEPDGVVVMTFSEPGGDLLLSFERSEAIALLADLAAALGFTLQRHLAPAPLTPVEPSFD